MKRISHRTVFLIILMALLILGIGLFTARYFLHAGEWVVFPGSPHVYAGGNLSTGRVTDRSGELLLDSTDGRVYSQDEALRKATLHLLGDRYGYISAPVLGEYADALVGFSSVNGLYSLGGAAHTARLTISAPVQKTAQAALSGRKGTVGVYNYKTGEILCAVTSPTFDPDNVPDIENDRTGAYSGVYVNRFFQTTYVPGSIFKIVTAAAALEQIPDILQQHFTCTGSWEVPGGGTIICNGVHGDVTLQQGFAKSCNVVFGQTALQLGAETLTAYAERFGLTEPMEIDGIPAAAGQFDLTDADHNAVAWAGIGQYTDLVNPCRFMELMGVVANGGQAAKPYLMSRVDGSLLGGYKAKTELTDRLLDEGAAKSLAIMMRNNVVSVYGAGQFPDLYVCAKSGTAELAPNETAHATFAGFIKNDQFPLAFVVIVENAGSGSAAAAPIAGQVLNACVEAMEKEK